MLLRTMVGLAQPRRCLDIGSFTGYTSSAGQPTLATLYRGAFPKVGLHGAVSRRHIQAQRSPTTPELSP